MPGRGNAAAALLGALLTVVSLVMPWAAYSGESGDLSWSGTDISHLPTDLSDRIDQVTTGIHVMTIAAGVVAVLSLLRLVAPTVRLAWLVLLGSAVALFGAIGAVAELNSLLSDGGAFTPSMQAGGAVAVLAAAVAFIAAIRGVVVQRRSRRRTEQVGQPQAFQPQAFHTQAFQTQPGQPETFQTQPPPNQPPVGPPSADRPQPEPTAPDQ
ncbi:hypothetical protein ACFQ9X_29775 [Catenulispora yoronensis]